jgi:2-oxoglutarate decarboxylase
MATSTTAVQTIDVVTPAAGESVTEGTILEWRVKVGDPIKVDDTIVEISTDKVDVELPSPASGTVSEILVEEGETVTVGQVIARISINGAAPTAEAAATVTETAVETADAAAAAVAETAEAAAAAHAAEAAEAAKAPVAETPVDSSKAPSQIVDVLTPAAGESVTEGTILEWRVKLGEQIAVDDTIVEISTDKVDLELPSPATGTVSEILVEEGDTVTVGQVIARIAVGDGVRDDASQPEPAPAQPAAAPEATQGRSVAAAEAATLAPPDGTKISPVAARAAAVEGVDLGAVAGSGPAGRITKSDVLSVAAGNGAAANGAATASATTAPEPSAQPLRGGAAALVRYMEQSRSIPTATSFRTLTVSVLDARRRELKAAGRKVSFTHVIAYAIARACEDMPVMATHFAEIDGKPFRMVDGRVNLGLAVDVEKKDDRSGIVQRTLMVPVINDAGRLTFDEFLSAYDVLVEKARTNTLTADDLVGANVTLTNPGGLGTVASVPRLLSGQGTIVATGSIAYPVGLAGVGASIGAEKVMTMTSTYDHRVI